MTRRDRGVENVRSGTHHVFESPGVLNSDPTKFGPSSDFVFMLEFDD